MLEIVFGLVVGPDRTIVTIRSVHQSQTPASKLLSFFFTCASLITSHILCVFFNYSIILYACAYAICFN